jgi:hypothetical protein
MYRSNGYVDPNRTIPGKTWYPNGAATLHHPTYEVLPGHWNNIRQNRRFLMLLYEAVGDEPFTNKQAYEIYAKHCWQGRFRIAEFRDRAHAELDADLAGMYDKEIGYGDCWMQMNCRNQLCTGAKRGTLIRLEPGLYRFRPY